MNINNNKNLKIFSVYKYNPYTDSHYIPVGQIRCLSAPYNILIEHANNVYPKLTAGWIYVVSSENILPFYNEQLYKQTNMNDHLKINSVNNLLQATRSNGFIVGSFNNGLSFAAEPTVHATASLARAEAKRLAGVNPGKYFIFVQIRGGEFVQPMPTSTSF